MSKGKRLFFAVEVPQELKVELEKFCETIDRNSWRPVKIDQLHVTLAFMEEVDESLLDRVIEIGDNAASAVSSFQVEISDTDVFPENGEPKVLFSKVNSESLGLLANMIRKDLGELADQRKFKAHLTLARKKGDRARKEIRKIRGAWKVDSFALFQSILSSEGPVHKELKRFNLK